MQPSPNAVRIRPSQGDAGIDVFIPGPAGWGKERKVWQIKRYCENLTGTEKRAIKRSFSRVVEASKKDGWQITKWNLVMPLDLTTQNLGWLDSYIADAGVDFPCETHGLLGATPSPRTTRRSSITTCAMARDACRRSWKISPRFFRAGQIAKRTTL